MTSIAEEVTGIVTIMVDYYLHSWLKEMLNFKYRLIKIKIGFCRPQLQNPCSTTWKRSFRAVAKTHLTPLLSSKRDWERKKDGRPNWLRSVLSKNGDSGKERCQAAEERQCQRYEWEGLGSVSRRKPPRWHLGFPHANVDEWEHGGVWGFLPIELVKQVAHREFHAPPTK